MDDPVHRCAAAAQMFEGRAMDALRRVESETETAAAKLINAAADLPILLKFPITRDRVMRWVDEGAGERRTAFGTTAWGTIRWDRSLGRPSTPRFADTFSFDHWYLWVTVIATEEGPPIVEHAWIKQPAPTVWDGPHDEENYRVSFMMRAVPVLANSFLVALKPNVQWNPAFPRWSSNRRVLAWPDSMFNSLGQFTVARDDVLVLDEYRVIKLL